MNIADKFNQKQQIQKEQQEVARKERVKELANKIISTLSNNEVIESLENYLVEKGKVDITDFGCLCQGGCCSWQKGLNDLLNPLIEEWGEKGIRVRPSLKLSFSVQTGRVSMYDNKKTIAEIVEWNKSKN